VIWVLLVYSTASLIAYQGTLQFDIGNLQAFNKDCEKQLNSDWKKDKNKTRRSANQQTKEGNLVQEEISPFQEANNILQECPKCGHTALMAIKSRQAIQDQNQTIKEDHARALQAWN
jgi:DNA-directed RNA polymerase subunit M/transcription elongation factor TFIIS